MRLKELRLYRNQSNINIEEYELSDNRYLFHDFYELFNFVDVDDDY